VQTIIFGAWNRNFRADANGIALEASWWVIDATGRPVGPGDGSLFADRDP
jgi:hypothetical protein